jgi:pyrroline-5-carboxylate reductase
MDKNYRLGFIGAGKLAGSVIRGLVRSGFCAANEIVANEPAEAARNSLAKDLAIDFVGSNAEVAQAVDTIFVAVKPGVVLPALRDISSDLANKLVISLAAGVRLPAMEESAPARVMRVLTNTPATVCRAASAIVQGARSTSADVDTVRKIFGVIGAVVEVTEEQIDAVTALSGSGPAFVYTVIEGLAKGGERVGLPPETALTLATQTVLGAGQLALESKLSPEDLRRMVVTPGGTTAAGLKVMDEMRTIDGLVRAVEAARKRAEEMARENR